MTAPSLKIKRLEARVKELEAALEPLSQSYKRFQEQMERAGTMTGSPSLVISLSDGARAYKLLAAERPERD